MSLEWLKLYVEASREAVMSNTPDDVRRGMLLLIYCAMAENGGVIRGCASWDRGKWMRLVGCYPIKRGYDVPGLWCWDGEDLTIVLYDAAAEEQAKNIRARRRQAASMRWARGEHGVSTGSSRGVSRDDGNNLKPLKQNKTGMQACNATCNAEENRIDKKEINKEKSGELLSDEEAMAELNDCHAIIKGRLAN